MAPDIDGVLLFAAGAAADWSLLQEILTLLLAAIVVGAIAEQLKQSVVVGYLIAGMLVGPNVLGGVQMQSTLMPVAELGVALLLFAIGLEFSPHRLFALGRTVLRIGILQILLTAVLGWGAALWCGLSGREALIVGMMVSVSSTATVLRVLTDRGELDSLYGRSAVGVLLLQDVAVIPMIVLSSAMRGGGSWLAVARDLIITAVLCLVLVVIFFLVFNRIVPRLLQMRSMRRNRDLPVLLAVLLAAGSAWTAHRVGLSPALGAFTAGLLLALSPFAVQIRADTRPLATVMVALFFAAIGMYGDPAWVVQHLPLVVGVLFAILLGKAVVIAVLARALRRSWNYAITVGCTLAQVGEFSFVLATIGVDTSVGDALITETTFRTMVSVTIASMMFTPYLIAVSPHLATGWERLLGKIARQAKAFGTGSEAAQFESSASHATAPPSAEESVPQVLVIGFGPAGQRVVEGLLSLNIYSVLVIDLNPDNIEIARRYGVHAVLGDATRRDVLEHAEIASVEVVVLTIPDTGQARHLIFMVRDLAPHAYILVRCRYHILHWALLNAGAHEVVDEEILVGQRLGASVQQRLAHRLVGPVPSDALTMPPADDQPTGW
ncbi:MAG: potassium transporter Kef [Pirellulaceae bacterium]|nr:MAG: potassium transporter Kef [Pirellulaceae bacterium]